MAFYQNLKIILDSQGLSNYEAAQKSGVPSQTIDNIINSKVLKPKKETLEHLSNGLNVSINKLLYGTDSFDAEKFHSRLTEKEVSLEDLVINANINPTYIIKNILPPEAEQKRIADYLGLSIEELFVPSRYAIDYLRSKNVKPYLRPDINSDPNTDEDMAKLYANLSPTAKRLVYNLAYDLSVIETENIVMLTPKDYWEKK